MVGLCPGGRIAPPPQRTRTQVIGDPRLREIERLSINAAPAVKRVLDAQAESIKRELVAKANQELAKADEERDPQIGFERQVDEEVGKVLAGRAWSARRMFIRALRMAAGLVLAAIAIWLFEPLPKIVGTPLVMLTLWDIVRLVFFAVATLSVTGLAIAVAFGSPPDRKESLGKAKEIAAAIVRKRNETEAETARERRKNEEAATVFRKLLASNWAEASRETDERA